MMGSPPLKAASRQGTRLPELDGLRGMAILLVLVFHYSRFVPSDSAGFKLTQYTNIAWCGVDLFFVLSGFLIGGILIDRKNSPNLFAVFYARRTLRIFPLYFLVFFSYLIFLFVNLDIPYLFDGQLPLWPFGMFLQNFSMAWTGTSGAAYMGATWSLAVEEQFYLVFPLVVYFMPYRKLPYFLVSCIVLAIPLRAVLYHWFSADHHIAFYVLMPCRADALAVGVLCAIVFRSRQLRTMFVQRIPWIQWLAVLTLAAFIFLTDPSISSRPMIYFFGYTALSLIFGSALLISLLGNPNSMIRRITNLTWLRSLGRIAFAVYLFHLPVVGFVFWIVTGGKPSLDSPGDIVVCLAAISFTIVLGWLSWVLFERHFIDFGSRFIYAAGKDIHYIPSNSGLSMKPPSH